MCVLRSSSSVPEEMPGCTAGPDGAELTGGLEEDGAGMMQRTMQDSLVPLYSAYTQVVPDDTAVTTPFLMTAMDVFLLVH